ncbi:IS200/IS605 family transposase [Aeromonas veronii]
MALKIEGGVPGYNNSYHFHASPKYRMAILNDSVAVRLEQLIAEKSEELGWKIHAMAVDDDHVHFLIESPDSPSQIAQRLFGYASFVLRKEFPALKEINAEHFWGGRQCKSVTDLQHFENTIAYINKHARSVP